MSHALDGRERRRNLLFLATPRLWPAWPFLPLVRRAGAEEECGLLVDLLGLCGLAGYSATVFLCNLFCLPAGVDGLLALPKEAYDTPEEVLAAGWRVD